MFRRIVALSAALAGLAASSGLAAPVEPQHNGYVLLGAELTGPCQDDQWPWNALPPPWGHLQTHLETNRWVVFVHDRGADGFTYDENAAISNDWLIYAVQPKASFNNDPPNAALDPGTCWRRAYDPTNVDARADGGPRMHYGWCRDPLCVQNDSQNDPNLDAALIAADPGRWRMEVWRERMPWVYDENGPCTPYSDPECWYQDDYATEGEDLFIERLERRDFTVAETFVTISEGPSGTVGQSDVLFDFAVVSDGEPPPGQLQCRVVELGGFHQCTPPTVIGGLPDGEHEFQVRYLETGQDPNVAAVTTRLWTSDTTPPVAQITQAPSGQSADREATITFTSTEPAGATFVCTVDGGSEYPCSSPERLLQLATGSHTFGVRATDAVGNQQSGFSQTSWTTVDPPPAGGGGGGGGGQPGPSGPSRPPLTTSCDGGGKATVTQGPLVFKGVSGTCFAEKVSPGKRTYTATGPVLMNGIQVTPASTTRIVVVFEDQHADVTFSGPVTLGFVKEDFTIPIPVGVAFSLDTLAGPEKIALKAIEELIKDRKITIGGLKVSGGLIFELSEEDGGTTKAGFKVELPSVFSAVRADGRAPSVSGVAFELALTATGDKGISIAAKGSIKQLFLLGYQLEDLALEVDSGPPLKFAGSVKFKLPNPRGNPLLADSALSVSLEFGDEDNSTSDAWVPGVSKFAVEAESINQPVGGGIFLQRLGAEAKRCSTGPSSLGHFEWSGSAGLSFGPEVKVPLLEKATAISADGTVKLKFCEPFSVELKGKGKIVTLPVADMKATYMEQRVDFSGRAGVALQRFGVLVGLYAEIKGFADLAALRYSATGTQSVALPVLGSARFDVGISSVGYAACLGANGKSFGVGKRWDQALQTIAQNCDVGQYAARRRQAGGAPTAFDVAADTRLRLLTATGPDGPPRIVVTGPGGEHLESPDPLLGSVATAGEHVLFADPELNATHVVLRDPTPGTWTLAPAPGAAPPSDVASAAGRPPVRITARVTNRGRKRRLSWRLTPQPGMRVEFFERGPTTSRLIEATSSARGARIFAPDVYSGGARRVEALVTQDGLPRTSLDVARFTAPAPLQVKRPAGLRRSTRTVSWNRQAAAVGYTAAFLGRGGTVLGATTTRRTALTIPARLRKQRFTLLVSAQAADESISRVASKTFRARRRT